MNNPNIYVDVVQFSQSFNNLLEDKKLTEQEHKDIMAVIRSSKSYGPGIVKRDEISYKDFCGLMQSLPFILQPHSGYKMRIILKEVFDFGLKGMHVAMSSREILRKE